MLKFPLNLKKDKDTNKFLTIDVDSDKVKCLAFYVPEKNDNEIASLTNIPTAKIIGVGVHKLEHGTVRNGVIINEDNLIEATQKALLEATRDQDEIKDVLFGVNGQLSFGSVTTAKINREKDSPISDKEFNDLQEKVVQAAFTQAQNDILQINGDEDAELEPITSSNVYLKVDGELADSAINKPGKTLEIAYFTAFTPGYHVKAFQHLAKQLGLNILAIGSEMYCILKSLQKSQDIKAMDCVLLDTDNDYTDVAIVFGGGIVATRSLDIGASHFTKAICQKTGLSYIEAEKMKRTYAYGKLSQTENELVHNCLIEPLKIWITGLRLLFGEFTGVKTFAPQILLIGEAAELPDVYEQLSKEAWTKSIPFKAPPEYKKISLRDLKTVTDSTGTLGSLEHVLNSSLSIIYLEMKGFLND